MNLFLCGYNHAEICFEGRDCPFCEMIKEKDDEIDSLKGEVEELKGAVENLERQIDES